MKIIIILSVLFFISVSSFATRLNELEFKDWLQAQELVSHKKILDQIAPQGTVPGVVIASPQKYNPNYFRHWVRDAALTMNVIVELNERTSSKDKKKTYQNLLKNYLTFSRQNQAVKNSVGLGEPIFEVNGSLFTGPWGRPQNDGPALRAITLIKWAQQLLEANQSEYVKTWLYTSEIPARTVIKADLEYVSHHWQEASFDLWEESKGDHFFTRMVQRKALSEGAVLAAQMHDYGAADWYNRQVVALDYEMEKFWNSQSNQNQFIAVTLNPIEGVDYKTSKLDSAVILGVLHGEILDKSFAVLDTRTMKTFEKLVVKFSEIYSINHQGYPGTAIGRYPEDLYAGTDFNGGNPWVLCTLAAAEYSYRLAKQISLKSAAIESDQKELINQWITIGDQFFNRVKLHTNPDGSMSEQIDRYTGFMVSARDLTWNYAAFFTTLWARQDAIKEVK